MFFVAPVWPRVERFPTWVAGLVLVQSLVFLFTWPVEKRRTHVATDNHLAQAARALVDAVARPGSGLDPLVRESLEREAARLPFPSPRLRGLLRGVSDQAHALSGEARFRWEADYPVFDSLDRALKTNPASTTPFHRYGFKKSGPLWPGLWTHMFLHAGFWHLFFNMLFLWALGALVEDRIGRWLIPLFLTGGAAAGAGQVVWGLPDAAIMVGASGAVSAVMGFALAALPHARVKMVYVVAPVISARWGSFDSPLWFFLPLWFFQQAVLGLMTRESASVSVGYGAHLAGFLAGLALGVFFRLRHPPDQAPAPLLA